MHGRKRGRKRCEEVDKSFSAAASQEENKRRVASRSWISFIMRTSRYVYENGRNVRNW